MIVELLRHGRENAIPRREIMDALDISDDRKFYSILADERRQGAVILSGCGYYKPSEDKEQARLELQAYNSMQRKKAIGGFENMRGARQALQKITDEVENE